MTSGIEAARKSIVGNPLNDEQITRLVQAYLAATLPADVAGLVQRLRAWDVSVATNGPVLWEEKVAPSSLRVEAADTIAFLSARLAEVERERDEFKSAIATPASVHANMLRGGIPMLSIRSALNLHGEEALARWDRAETAEASLAQKDAEIAKVRNDALDEAAEALDVLADAADYAAMHAMSDSHIIMHRRDETTLKTAATAILALKGADHG